MNMLLGEKLKKARKNIGMSQNEVAEELMLSRQTISKWENNVCLPDLENFQRICKLYKVDFNTILSKDEGKFTLDTLFCWLQCPRGKCLSVRSVTPSWVRLSIPK